MVLTHGERLGSGCSPTGGGLCIVCFFFKNNENFFIVKYNNVLFKKISSGYVVDQGMSIY